jgi:hypothetical protein
MISPDTLAKSNTEHAHQRAFFAWLAYAASLGFEDAKAMCDGGRVHIKAQGVYVYPELALMHAIPNGGFRNKAEAGKLKAEGVKAGVLDTFLPVPKKVPSPVPSTIWYHGLYIEFKEPKRKNHKDGGLSQAQLNFGDGVQAQGYCVRVAYTWREAANLVMLYYGVDTRLAT